MNKINKPTTKDVADLAGVSQSTVSMILNNKTNASFSQETIHKVVEAARSLSYKTKEKNEGLFGIQSQLIAVISPTLSNPYYASLIQAIENEATIQGYSLFICNTYHDQQKERKYLDLLSHSAICGIIYTYMPFHKEIVKVISLKIPVVIIGDKNEVIDIDTVELNSIESGVIMGKHLLSLGHKNIAFISTPLSENSVPRNRRLEGIKLALGASEVKTNLIVREAEVDVSEDNYDVNLESKIGYDLALDIIGKEDVTALVGVNDMVAYGIFDALAEKKFKVPEDYSVCGFDNIFPSAFSGMSLTTVDHFISYKGKDAFEILFKKISNKSLVLNPTSIFKVEYKPILIKRNSTGICRK